MTVFPTYYNLSRKLSKLSHNDKDLCILLFLNYAENKFKSTQCNPLFKDFAKLFSNLIKNEYYDMLLDIFGYYYKNKNNDNIIKAQYNWKIYSHTVNLINKCKRDKSETFLYSNLGTKFLDVLTLCFMNNNINLMSLLLKIVKH